MPVYAGDVQMELVTPTGADKATLFNFDHTGTPLADADVYITGAAPFNVNLHDLSQADFWLVATVALIAVLIILIVMLRSLVAPLFLVASVVLSYAASMGLGVLVWQDFLGHKLDWTVPGVGVVLTGLVPYQELRAQDVRLGLADTVTIPGYVDPDQAMAEHDVLAMLSASGGTGVTGSVAPVSRFRTVQPSMSTSAVWPSSCPRSRPCSRAKSTPVLTSTPRCRVRPAFTRVVVAPPESADYVICSGLFDEETETPDDYRDILLTSWNANGRLEDLERQLSTTYALRTPARVQEPA